MNKKAFEASLIIRGEADEDLIRDFAMVCLMASLTRDQKIVFDGIRIASPCRPPSGKDGGTMAELIVFGLVHETTYRGKGDYYSLTPLGLEVAECLDRPGGENG